MPTIPVPSLGPVSSLTDSTQIGLATTRLTNILLRPNLGFRGIPIYERLFGIGTAATVQATFRALTFNGTPVGDTAPRRAANKTIAIQVTSQAKHFLLLYSLTATSKPARGWFYLGEKGTPPAALNLDGGTVTYTVLAVGLDADARWYGTRTYSQWMLGNGIDDNVCVQLNRTSTPGIWRKAASNARPAAPVISLVAPSNTGLTQASVTFASTLKLTADEDNFPGASGNDRIRVTITPTVAALASTLIGTGTPTVDPFNYAITGGISSGTSPTYSTASQYQSFIATDTKILSVLTASLVGADSPITTPLGPSYLAGGAGTGTSEGFSDRAVTILARYWDPGQEGLGYEGISSDESNTLVIAANQNYDIRVRVTPDPSAEGGRFPFIRIYMNTINPDTGEEIWNLMNPDDPIPNTAATSRTFTVSTSTDTLTTASAHGLIVGDIIRLTTTGTLPAPLALNTDYVVTTTPTATTLKLSLTVGGTPVNITTTGTGTHTLTQQRIVQLGTSETTVIGPAMAEDQNRPLPHLHNVLAGKQTFSAGVTGHQERLYASKEATSDELAPEGANTDAFIDIQSSTSHAGSSEITALYTDQQWLHIHTATGIILKPLSDLTQTREPQIATGAINGTTFAVLPDRRMLYLGADLSLVAFDSSLQLQEIVGNATTLSAQATAYIRSRVDTNAIAANNDRATVFLDSAGQLLWFYLPGLDGSLIGFAYDLIANGICGEFTYPKIYAATQMERTRPEILFCDEDGNLFYTDPTRQPDSLDQYGDQGAFAPQPTADPIPTADAGYGNEILDLGDGNGPQRYLRAVWSRLETGYWDLGDPENRKAFLHFLWRTIGGSRAILKVRITTLTGDQQEYTYGDVGLYGANHRCPLMLTDSALKLEMDILQSQQKKWAIRDLAFTATPQGPASV